MKFIENVAFWKHPGTRKDVKKIFAFDLDQTLVTTKSGATFPRSGSDWRWQTPQTKSIVSAVAQHSTIVIFTNQGGVVPNKAKKSFVNLEERVTQVLNDLDLPCVRVYAACKNPENKKYRKPNPGMWDLMLKDLQVAPDMTESIYVGDAAGRKQDHSDADVGFAAAVGVRFLTPEEFEAEFSAATKRPLESDESSPKKLRAKSDAQKKPVDDLEKNNGPSSAESGCKSAKAEPINTENKPSPVL